MTDDLSPLARTLLGGVRDDAMQRTRGYREDIWPATWTAALERTQLAADRHDVISQAAYEFIVRWETGGRSYYERVIGGRPVWPGYASGITIGCGYDLGYHTTAQFEADWATRLGRAQFDRLGATLGFRTAEPDRPAKVEKAKALVASLSDIVIPWPVAIEQFDTGKLPALIAELYRSLDNLELLHPHCRGALLSLVFNRGPAFVASADRYAEMRAIAAAMREGADAFTRIPGLLQAMRRIWGPSSSLSERREGEARLFEAGLSEARLVAALGNPIAVGAKSLGAAEGATEMHEDIAELQSDDPESDEPIDEIPPARLEGAAAADAVRWNPVDDEQPDYRHLDRRLAGTTAEILPDDLEALIRANDFAPRPGKIVFALRGAGLVGADRREDVGSLFILDQRPDHRTFRCVIGVYDPAARRLWAYQASTVPNAEYVLKCHRDFRAGVPVERLVGNILPTGCYTMTVGTHRPGTSREIPTVLRLSTTAGGASRVVVLRSLDDACYDRFDRFVAATPADNIHPAQRSTGFSSAGCLTLPGRYAQHHHTGAWQAFRVALGIDENSGGHQFPLVLLTGLDAVMAAEQRVSGNGMATLRRLRQGSQGAAVARLQAALGLAPDASQLLGPVTRAALVRAQTDRLGWADGIYAPATDELLGFRVFTTGAPEAAAAAPRSQELPASEDPLAPVLENWHTERALPGGGKGPPVRFVARFAGRPPPESELASTASVRLGLPVAAGPLFGPDPELDHFRVLRVGGVSRPDRADLFEVAAALRTALGATVVEPDLGTDYYCDERSPPDRAGPESADLAFWCWADPDRDKPADADWGLAKTHIREAWAWAEAAHSLAQGEGILVFQPDTGVVSAHAELPPNIAHDPRAANFVEGSGPAEDPMHGGLNPGHGTGTASVVASPINGLMAGAAPRATLVPIRCLESVAVFDQSAVARAIDHARRNGAHVITMSLGGVPSEALHAALRRAVQDNIIVIAAAGNCVEEVVWPARYSEAIAIGGINEALRPWRGSSHGPAVTICGPAEFVLRADAHDPQHPLAAVSGGQGTSFATALIAGIAALWLAHHGRARLISMLPPGRRLQDMFRNLLTRTAEVPPGHDVHEFGAGVVQAQVLLASDPQLAFVTAAAAPSGAEDMLAGLVSLVSRIFGRGGHEAVTPVLLSDRQHAAEIACAALDRARLGGTRRAYLESLPPVELSPALRRRLGPAAAVLR